MKKTLTKTTNTKVRIEISKKDILNWLKEKDMVPDETKQCECYLVTENYFDDAKSILDEHEEEVLLVTCSQEVKENE